MGIEEKAQTITRFVLYVIAGIAALTYAAWPLIKPLIKKIRKLNLLRGNTQVSFEQMSQDDMRAAAMKEGIPYEDYVVREVLKNSPPPNPRG